MISFDGLVVEQDQIRTLLAIAQHKSFNRAAGALGVRQPAVSQQMRRLEDRLGRALFVRSASGVEPTPDGEAMMVYVKALVDLSEDMRRRFSRRSGEVTVRIGLAEDFSRSALPHLLTLLAERRPDICIRASCLGFDRTVTEFDERRLDVIVVRQDLRLHDAEPLLRTKVAWYGRKDTPRPVPDPVPLLLAPGPTPLRTGILDALSAARRTWRIPLETLSLATAEAAMRAGVGVTALPRGLALGDLVELGPEAGLPDVPDRSFVMKRHAGREGEAVEIVASALRTAAAMSFPPDAHS